jgi:hypothetical protein
LPFSACNTTYMMWLLILLTGLIRQISLFMSSRWSIMKNCILGKEGCS